MNGQYPSACTPGCVAEHSTTSEPCAFEPIAVPVLDPDTRAEPVILVGGFRDRAGRTWIEVDVDGHGALVDTDVLAFALAAVRGQVTSR